MAAYPKTFNTSNDRFREEASREVELEDMMSQVVQANVFVMTIAIDEEDRNEDYITVFCKINDDRLGIHDDIALSHDFDGDANDQMILEYFVLMFQLAEKFAKRLESGLNDSGISSDLIEINSGIRYVGVTINGIFIGTYFCGDNIDKTVERIVQEFLVQAFKSISNKLALENQPLFVVESSTDEWEFVQEVLRERMPEIMSVYPRTMLIVLFLEDRVLITDGMVHTVADLNQNHGVEANYMAVIHSIYGILTRDA